MGPRFDRKLGLLAALAAVACTLAIGSLAFLSAQKALREGLRSQARATASQLAARASDELHALTEHSLYYVSTSQPKAFESDGQLLALSVLTKPAADSSESDEWAISQRWLLPETNPARLAPNRFAELDLKYPVDFDRIAQGKSDVIFADPKGSTPFLRLAFAFGERTPEGYKQAIVAEVKLGKWLELFSSHDGVSSFLTGARGQLIVSGANDGALAPSDDLSQLEILKAARNSTDSQGVLDYRMPGQTETQFAAFARVAAFPGLTVVAQAPRSRTWLALEPLIRAIAAGGSVFTLLIGSFAWWFSSRWSWELQVAPQGQNATHLPPLISNGENPRPFAKIHDAQLRQALETGRHKLTGEKLQAAVLHTHLHGIDQLSSQADPEKLLELLNQFHQKAVQAVESRHGIVDQMHGGSVIAFWGVPQPQENDVHHAIQAAAEISEAAHHFNQALSAQNWRTCRLGMGLHYGALAVGQVGTAGRLEYSAVGEALETAARIQSFTEEFGTDFLMTGAAAQRAGEDFATERVTAGDEGTPELFELAEEDSESELSA